MSSHPHTIVFDRCGTVPLFTENLHKLVAKSQNALGKRVLGRYAVLRQSWRDSPTSREPRRNLRPTFVARSIWALMERAQRKHEWEGDYLLSRRALLAGEPALFPHGTYWLRRFVGVSVVPPQENS